MARKDPSPIPTPFINLQTDFGFKRTFGTRRFQNNALRLLEAALGDEIEIRRMVLREDGTGEEGFVEPRYRDKEVLPAEEDGKRIVYDVYFTMRLGKGKSSLKPRHIGKEDAEREVEHHFILEMQNVYTLPFEDRMAYYLSRAVAEQGKAGWNYDLDPVVLMCVTDFDFPHLTPQPVQEFEWREKKTGESLTKKLRMLFFSLRQVPEKWRDCRTDLEKRLFILKNMDKMDKNSEAYKDGGYSEMFDAAESVSMSNEDVVAYSQSMARMREYQSGLDYRYQEGFAVGEERGIAIGEERGIAIGEERGIAIGEERGIALGRISEKEETARKMKAAGIDIEFIAQITEIPPQRILEL